MGLRFSMAGVVGVLGVGLLVGGGCEGMSNVGGAAIAEGDGDDGSGAGEPTDPPDPPGPLPKADKVDLLLMIDNSQSMADKQEVLALALGEMMASLTNPLCIDKSGIEPSMRPASGLDPCPPGLERWFTPVTDIHLGIVSSSIGGYGGDACQNTESSTNNDRGHLLARWAPDEGNLPTYQDSGFLLLDSRLRYDPPGESNAVIITQTFEQMVENEALPEAWLTPVREVA